jgi:hypothetical protein
VAIYLEINVNIASFKYIQQKIHVELKFIGVFVNGKGLTGDGLGGRGRLEKGSGIVRLEY